MSRDDAGGHERNQDADRLMSESGKRSRGGAAGGNRGGHHRLRRRRQSHEAAINADHAAATVPEHPLIPTNHPDLLTSQGELLGLLEHVREVGLCAYDTEFIGELTYWPKLCLVQIATPERVAVIDALADVDLTPVWQVLADPAVLKIVHAGSQDLEPVVRHMELSPANIFDTQIAAGFCALPYPLSLSKLVETTTDVRLGKTLTFTSWDERPLSRAHVRYAADDVRYLPAVHQGLARRLEERGHTDKARQEFEAICEPALYRFDPRVTTMRMRGARSMSPKQLAVMLELVAVRDEGAQQLNVPPRSLIRDEVLTDMSRRHVSSYEQLRAVRGLPRPVIEEFGQRLLDATQRGLAVPKNERIVQVEIEETATERFAFDALWTAVQGFCLASGIDPALVGTRQDVVEYWRARHDNGPSPRRQRLVNGWRSELVGGFIDRFTTGERALELRWSDGGLVV